MSIEIDDIIDQSVGFFREYKLWILGAIIIAFLFAIYVIIKGNPLG